ncbi:MAG: peptidoglycan binding domain-containing protein [Blautia sp.]
MKEVDLEAEDCYEKPSITSENKDLVARYQTLVKYSKMSVTYAFGDSREVLDSTTIRSWMTVSESGEASFSDEQIEDYVAGLAEKYDTFGKDVAFTTALGETVTVNSCDYGWQLDQASEGGQAEGIFTEG